MRYACPAVFLAAAFIVTSCAGFVPASGDKTAGGGAERRLTVELYDLRNYRLAEGRRALPREAPVAQFLPDAALPEISLSPSALLKPGTASEVVAGTGSRAARAALLTPPIPRLPAAAPVELSVQRPARRTRFPLTRLPLPPAPVSAPVAGKAAASPVSPISLRSPSPAGKGAAVVAAKPPAKPAAPAAPAAKPAAQPAPAGERKTQTAQLPAAVQSPAARAPSAQAAAAAAPASPAPASQAPAARAPSPQARTREIFARTGDEVEIGLEGTGYVFLGFPAGQSDGMVFKAKEVKDRKSSFRFKALKIGSYDLGFLLQDNTSGKSSRETIRVHVVSDAEFAAAVEGPGAPAPDQAPPAEAGDPDYAEKLASLGKHDAALQEYLKGYKDGDPRLNDRIATLALLSGSPASAEKYYRKNLLPAGPFTESAVVGLVRIAVERKDSAAFLSLLKPFFAVKGQSIELPLIEAARFQRERGEIGVGLELISQYLSRYPEGSYRDEADFIRAGLLEAASPFLDIEAARDLYRGILDRFPESAFAGPARERLRYIEQHFYLIR